MKSLFKGLIFGVLLMLIFAIANVGLMALSGWFISAAAVAGLAATSAYAFNYLIPAAGVRFFALLRIGGRYGERLLNHDALLRLLQHLRVWVYDKVVPLAPAYLHRRHSGDVLQTMVGDIDTLNNLYLRVLIPFLSTILLLLGLFVFIDFFSVKLALEMVFWLLLIAIVVPACSYLTAQRTSKALIAYQRQMRTKIVITLQHLSDILLFSQAQQWLKELLQLDRAYFKLQLKISILQGFFSAINVLFLGASILLTLWMGLNLVAVHQLNPDNLALLILTLLAVYSVLSPLTSAFAHLGESRVAISRLMALKSLKPEVVFPNKSKVVPTQFDIQFSNIDFGYDDRELVFKQFNLHIPMGEQWVISGLSGVGKSSLLQLLARFYEPFSGQISIGGVRLHDFSETDLRAMMGIVPQQPHCFNATIRDNLTLAAPDADDERLWEALVHAQLADEIKQFPDGLDTWIGELGLGLSGGQLRRLAIARALLHDAPILILDEPSEGLDHALAMKLMAALKETCAEKTMIIITHDHAIANRVENRIHLTSKID